MDWFARAAQTALLLVVALLLLALSATVSAVLGAELPPPAAARYQRLLTRQAHMQWGLNAPIAAMAAQVQQESAWNPQAVSRAGARGLAQFMPATATWWCEKLGLSVTACQPHNATWALRALAGYDKFLYDRVSARFGPFDRLWLALRGYNGGEGHVTAEAKATGLAAPTRQQIDAACGQARRAKLHCAENLGYPARILLTLQPRYATWGPQVLPVTEAAR
ncbi:MAG: lytic transglycosylase domain-containing protein [Burkholderiaceae bacterium]|nr:MAG: lytic transglycosylase domain-containing protein [Burkholderiaceae bacterium]